MLHVVADIECAQVPGPFNVIVYNNSFNIFTVVGVRFLSLSENVVLRNEMPCKNYKSEGLRNEIKKMKMKTHQRKDEPPWRSMCRR